MCSLIPIENGKGLPESWRAPCFCDRKCSLEENQAPSHFRSYPLSFLPPFSHPHWLNWCKSRVRLIIIIRKCSCSDNRCRLWRFGMRGAPGGSFIPKSEGQEINSIADSPGLAFILLRRTLLLHQRFLYVNLIWSLLLCGSFFVPCFLKCGSLNWHVGLPQEWDWTLVANAYSSVIFQPPQADSTEEKPTSPKPTAQPPRQNAWSKPLVTTQD